MSLLRVRGRTKAEDNDGRGAGRITLGYLTLGIALVIALEVALAQSESSGVRVAGNLGFLAATGAILMVLTRRELTRRRNAEQRIENAQRLEALGRLAGGVAHDFNNLLTVIIGFSELVQRRLPEDDPSRDDLAAVLRSGEKARSLVDQLLTLSNRGVTNPVVLDPNETIASLSEVLRRVLGSDIDLDIATSDAGKVLVDPTQLGQILLNLVVNAGDAITDRGRVTIATVPGSMSTGKPAVIIGVSDTGRGMDPETTQRCFEPFFTARADGKGTGLGLAIVFGAVTQAGGEISVASSPGQGSTFTIRLPRTEAPAVVDLRATDAPGSARVLLVDDDEAVRTFAGQVLEDDGYLVTQTASAEAALEIIARDGPPDLVITDVVMPGIGGLELAERLARQAPLTPVLLISGFVDDLALRNTGASAGLPLLPKPFRAADLLDAASDALRGGRRAYGSNR
jgi:signal transduction histidine kinase